MQKGKIVKLLWAKNDSNLCVVSYFEGKWAIKIIDVIKGNVLLSTYINNDTTMSNALVNNNLVENNSILNDKNS